MNEKLRPMTLGEILDRTAQLYRHNFLPFVGVAALPILATLAVFVPFGIWIGYTGVAASKGTPTDQTGFIAMMFLAFLVAFPVVVGASVLEQAALTLAAVTAHMGAKFKVREVIKSVWPRFWRYVWLLVLQGLLVAGAPMAIAGIIAIMLSAAGWNSATTGVLVFLIFAAAVVYAIWAYLRYSLAMPVCVVEDRTGSQSIDRASTLSKGTRGRIFVMFLLVAAISIVITLMVDMIVLIGMAIFTAMGASKTGIIVLVGGQILNFAANFILQTLIAPVSVIALVLFYYDQRVRNEGFDIELLMEQAGMTALPANPKAEPEPATPAPAIESPLTPPFDPAAGPDTVKES